MLFHLIIVRGVFELMDFFFNILARLILEIALELFASPFIGKCRSDHVENMRLALLSYH